MTVIKTNFAYRSARRPVVPENSIREDSHNGAESAHHPPRCLPSSTCLERLSSVCSTHGVGLNSRIFYRVIISALPWGVASRRLLLRRS